MLDPEITAFVARTEQHYPASANTAPVAENRAAYDRMCVAFRAPYPPGVAVADECLDIEPSSRRLAIRRYQCVAPRRDAILLYLHGGGFVLGGLHSHDDVCAELCDKAASEVVALDYRLAPEHPYPVAVDDAEAAYRWLLREGRPIAVGGDSAGGNLTAALCLRLRRLDLPQPIGQLLIYPGLGGNTPGTVHTEAPLLSASNSAYYRALYAGGVERIPDGDPEFAPLLARDFRGLPPASIFAAEVDPLCGDAVEYARRLRRDGVATVLRVEKGLVHGYLRARHCSAKAADSFAAIARELERLANRHGRFP
jgi:acetyl esterase